MDIFELETKAALADMWLHENKMLKEENAKLKEAAKEDADTIIKLTKKWYKLRETIKIVDEYFENGSGYIPYPVASAVKAALLEGKE